MRPGVFSRGLAMYLRRTISVLRAEAAPKRDPKLAETSEIKKYSSPGSPEESGRLVLGLHELGLLLFHPL